MSKQPPEQLPVEQETIQEEELVPVDDAIIGRAFRWSLLLFAGVGAVIALFVWQFKRPEQTATAPVEKLVAAQPIRKVAEVPSAPFTDVTVSSGIDFVHENGAHGEKLLPETMGGGCAFLDYDNDEDQDILLINSTYWPEDIPEDREPPTMALYRNNGVGSFDKVTPGSGLDVSFYGMGPAVGDYDNDGDVDVFVTAVGSNRLFENDAGKFTQVATNAGVTGDPSAWSTGSAFFDYDNDGDLDLFVCNYIKWSREIDLAVNFTLVGVGRAYGQPTQFEGADSYLYRNNGDGTFTDVSESSGVRVANPATGLPMGKALAVAPVDIDRDGLLDLFVANDTVQNFLFHNLGDGTFKEVGTSSGVAFDSMGQSTGAMGTDVADFRNDNTLGLGIGNFANEMTSLYLSDGDPWQFTDVAIIEGVGSPSRLSLSFGLFFFDFDLDGRLDLLQCNGHLEEEINKVQPSQNYRQPAQLFWNTGGRASACFAEIAVEKLGDLAKPIVGRGAAYADIDADGDLDVLLTQIADAPLLLCNDQNSGHHWLRVKLVGSRCNRDAIGARIVLVAGGETQQRTVQPTRSYLSQVELPITFGLNNHPHIQSLRVTWPGGDVQEITPPNVDQTITIEQPE